MDERKILIAEDDPEIREAIGRAMIGLKPVDPFRFDPLSELFLMAFGMGVHVDDALCIPTLKGEPAWKSRGRHQGTQEKARRLRQKAKEEKRHP